MKQGELKSRLDELIKFWQDIRDEEVAKKDPNSLFSSIESTAQLKAECYIDAYEIVRRLLLQRT